MLIKSAHSGYQIEFDSYSSDRSLYFMISAKLGMFAGENNSIQLFDKKSFSTKFDAFVTDRSLTPTLKGSHGFELKFFSKKDNGHPWLAIKLCDFAHTDNEDHHFPLFCVSGEFEVNHEYLSSYVEYFKSIA